MHDGLTENREIEIYRTSIYYESVTRNKIENTYILCLIMDSISSNIDSITVDKVSEIQRALDPYDVRSLVFLLYDTSYTALQRLTLLQRVSGRNLDSLHDWAKQANSRATWRYEFLEALSICQLYGIIRKLGFDVRSVKLHFLPNNLHVNIYINPVKKALYKLCESMTSDNFLRLKNSLSTYNIDIRQFEACELVLLELMCNKFIVVNRNNNENDSTIKYQIENLTRIIETLPGMKDIALNLKQIENTLNKISTSVKNETLNEFENTHDENNYKETFEHLDKLCLEITDEDIHVTKLKTDATKIKKQEAYPIINKDRVGVCYIINQEIFYPSKDSINMNCEPLEDRKGSDCDERQLKLTMEAFNFKVFIHRNLTRIQMINNIRDIIKYKVHKEDSIFMLCILSHGVEGCIYSSDSVKVKIREIKNMLDNEDASHLIGKPKVLILQACQDTSSEPIRLVPDGPTNKYTRKADFLILWATVPEFSAYREESIGSVFIQLLCNKIKESAEDEHLADIFHKVNDSVIRVCQDHNYEQVPLCESTLRKKLYLKL